MKKVKTELLGKIPDREVARISGCSLTTVRDRRNELGIPAAKPSRIEIPREWLGVLPDREIARRVKCNYKTVSLRRKELGIPPAVSARGTRRTSSVFKEPITGSLPLPLPTWVRGKVKGKLEVIRQLIKEGIDRGLFD